MARVTTPRSSADTPRPPGRRATAADTSLPGRGIAALCAALVITMSVLLLDIPYFVLQPGPSIDVGGLIEIEGASTGPVRGELLLTTVSLHEIQVAEAIRGWFDPNFEIVSRSVIIGEGESDEDAGRRVQLQMTESHEHAAASALALLGYDVKITPLGARVTDVVPNSPARRVLRRGDLIVTADSTPVRRGEDLEAVMRRHRAGDAIDLEIVRDGKTSPVTITTVGSAPDPDVAIIGVYLDTPQRIELPLAVDIEARGVGGPSAGLMYALGIVDLLDDRDLTQGRSIAGTGEIDVSGEVGPVGGIRHKVRGARERGVDLFVVPAPELRDACAHAGAMPVVGVRTLADAVRALSDNAYALINACP